MSYKAIITRIEVRPHPNADRLALGICMGNQVVIGKDVESGTLGIFFPTDGQLTKEYAVPNDLIRRKDEVGNPAGGMFDENLKVRSQKLRGERSDGFWTSLDTLEHLGDISVLKEGDVLDEFNGTKICQKYFSRKTREARNKTGEKKKKKIDSIMFHKHVDTEQFRYYADKIPHGALCTLTLKMHGTSQRSALVLVPDAPTWLEKLRTKFDKKFEVTRQRWTELVGSRNVTLSEEREAGGFYGTDQFRFDAHNKYFAGKLRKGETIYYELVGWVNKDTPIMNPGEISKLKDKELTKQYGDKMYFKYGCPQGTWEVYVYRITMTNEDGQSIEYSWNQVKQRCHELAVKTVHEILSTFTHIDVVESGLKINLRELVEEYTEGPDLVDPSHIREGVVLRVDTQGGTDWYKNKSHTFGVLEGYIKEKDDVVDIEEAS